VIRTGANDVYVTDRGMVPATREVVRRIDLAAGAMVVELPEEI
jgi:ribosomal 30S subunit maturation factor RimM